MKADLEKLRSIMAQLEYQYKTNVKLQYESDEEIMVLDGHCKGSPSSCLIHISNNYNSAFMIEVC